MKNNERIIRDTHPPLEGKEYNGVTFIKYLWSEKAGKIWVNFWDCKCHCGRIFSARETAIKYGTTKSCGCLRRLTTQKTGLANKKENIIQHSEHGYDRVFYRSKRYKDKYYICDRNEITEVDCYSRHKRKGPSFIFDPIRVVKETTIEAARVIMNTPAGMECDHINGYTEDLRKVNLRNCTQLQNKANTPKGVGSVKRIKGGKYIIVFPKEMEYDTRNLFFDTKNDAKTKLHELQVELFGDFSYERSQKIAKKIETYEFIQNDWVEKWANTGTLGKILRLPPDNPLNAKLRDLKIDIRAGRISPDEEWIIQHELMYEYAQMKKSI